MNQDHGGTDSSLHQQMFTRESWLRILPADNLDPWSALQMALHATADLPGLARPASPSHDMQGCSQDLVGCSRAGLHCGPWRRCSTPMTTIRSSHAKERRALACSLPICQRML